MKWTTGNTILAVGGVGLLLFVGYKAFNPTQPIYTPPPGGSSSVASGTDYFASFIRGVTGGIGDIVRSGSSPSGNNTSQSGNPRAGGAGPATGVSPSGSTDPYSNPRSGAYSPSGGFDFSRWTS